MTRNGDSVARPAGWWCTKRHVETCLHHNGRAVDTPCWC
jgi:hypothetical protein